MKSTIKIDAGKSIVVQPNKTGPGVSVSLVLFGASMASAVLTPDQCAALILGIEIASEKAVSLCGQVSNGIACQIPRNGIEKICPDCNPWRPA